MNVCAVDKEAGRRDIGEKNEPANSPCCLRNSACGLMIDFIGTVLCVSYEHAAPMT